MTIEIDLLKLLIGFLVSFLLGLILAVLTYKHRYNGWLFFYHAIAREKIWILAFVWPFITLLLMGISIKVFMFDTERNIRKIETFKQKNQVAL